MDASAHETIAAGRDAARCVSAGDSDAHGMFYKLHEPGMTK